MPISSMYSQNSRYLLMRWQSCVCTLYTECMEEYDACSAGGMHNGRCTDISLVHEAKYTYGIGRRAYNTHVHVVIGSSF